MRYSLSQQQCRNFEYASRREWLLPNGIGGYAMGTASGANSRRYHGHLVAATDPFEKRVVLLANIEAEIQGDGPSIGLSTNQYVGTIYPAGYQYLQEFSTDSVCMWRYLVEDMRIEKRLAMHPGENASTSQYRNIGDKTFTLTLRPLVCHKFYHGNFTESADYPRSLRFEQDRTLIEDGGLTLVLLHPDAHRLPVQGWYYRFEHHRELERGLDARDDLFCPCELRYRLHPGEAIELVASEGAASKPYAFSEPEPSPMLTVPELLKEAAPKFLIRNEKRSTILAGYPWFTDWGRDTMISLPGLCLCTGRYEMAREILLDYAGSMRHGLLPNRFVEEGEPEYHTADATLWFANAVYKTLQSEWDEAFAKRAFSAVKDAFEHHMNGTLFGIRIDPTDGLLTQGQEGLQLTWMDAKIEDWVVTPRRGKTVELNGLWINLCRVLEWMAEKLGQPPAIFTEAAQRAEQSFARFWCEDRGHYYDTIDPNDEALRPNQVIAMALPFPAARGEQARRALQAVTRDLLTPYGLRTLGPGEQGYRGRFRGPLRELDAAYHQGTVWPWLLGPYLTALVRLTGDRAEAKRIVRGVRTMLEDYGLGGIAEVYDGDSPHGPGGCPWQAWSVAEILRAWHEDVLEAPAS
jgi:glycogen debranching enzyme